MQRNTFASLSAAALILGFLVAGACAEEDTAALAKALSGATVTLEQGLAASEREGKPISGKYEIEDGALQLSFYTAQSAKFTEVIVDPTTGAIKKAEAITDAGDLKDAKGQIQAMDAARLSLSSAAMQAATGNQGYTVVRIIPTLKNGHPVADISLMKSKAVKKIEQKLD
jgi:hypothetical protein